MIRGLSPQEIGYEMDLPVGVLKWLSIVVQVDSSVLMKLVAMPPLDIIQASTAHLLFPSSNGIDVDLLLS